MNSRSNVHDVIWTAAADGLWRLAAMNIGDICKHHIRSAAIDAMFSSQEDRSGSVQYLTAQNVNSALREASDMRLR